MAVYDQIVTTYSDTTPHVRVIADVITIIDPRDHPLIDVLGLASANAKFKINQSGYKLEILEDEYDPLTTTANQGTTIATDATTLTVADASVFQVGHVIKIDDEYMVISSVDTTNETVGLYARDYGGTNATHTTLSAIEIVGMARLEGADASYGPIVDVTAPFNYTSIFQKGLNISETQRVIDQYGKDDEFNYQANKALPHLMRLVNKAAYHGIRDAGTAAAPRSMGGLDTFITDNTVGAGGAIAKSDIDNLMEEIIMDGGKPDLMVLSPRVANDVRNLIDSSSFVRVGQENDTLGMNAITRVDTQYGPLRMVEDRWCPTSVVYLLDSRKVGYYTLRPFGWSPLAKTGDSDKAEVVGEFSLMVAHDKAHGKITGVTT